MTNLQDAALVEVSATQCFIAGCAAGVTGCIVGHPFDTVKLVQQTSSVASTSSLAGSTSKLLKAGGQRALWAGLGPALAVQVLTSGFLFGAQASISALVAQVMMRVGAPATQKKVMPSEYRLQQAMVVSSVPCSTLSGFLTGGLLSPLVCPLEAIKCRSQVAPTSQVQHVGSKLRGLYSGYTATVLRCSSGNAAFFGVYALTQQMEVHAGLGGALAGAAFWIAGMPFDVIKSRMQTAQDPLPLMATLRQAVQQGGPRMLYAGLPVTLMRAVPMNAAVLFTYETVIAQDIHMFCSHVQTQ